MQAGRSDDGAHTMGRTPVPAAVLARASVQEPREIDWKQTVAWLTGIVTLGVILKAVLGALWERLVYSAIKERLTAIESTAAKIAEKLETLDDRFTMVEASQMEHGKAIQDLTRLSTIEATLDRLDQSMSRIDTHVQGLQRWQSYVEGTWAEQRREGSPTMLGGRRKDDPPRRRE